MFDLLKLNKFKKQLQLSLVGVNGLSDSYRHCFGCEGNCSGNCMGMCADDCGGSCVGACHNACTDECTYN